MDAVSDVLASTYLVRFPASDYVPNERRPPISQGERKISTVEIAAKVLSRHHFPLSIDFCILYSENRKIFTGIVSDFKEEIRHQVNRIYAVKSFFSFYSSRDPLFSFHFCAFGDIYIVDWRRSSRRVERKLIKIHIAHINRGRIDFYRRQIR